MKPKFLFDVLRQTSPRKFNGNRYNVLRDASPADSIRSSASFRPRSQSVKRKNSGDFSGQMSYSEIASGNTVSAQEKVSKIEEINVGIATVQSVCDKVTTDIGSGTFDPAVVTLLTLLNDAIVGINNNQKKLLELHSEKNTTACVPIPGNSNDFVTQKKPRQELPTTNYVDLATISQRSRSTLPTPRAIDPQVKKFKDSVREAEKSTLVFNLNMGKTPIINQETMSTRVTQAITAKAAELDGMPGKFPKEETIAALDDVLSIVKGMKFYGRATKTYTNARDNLSGSYCTIPVRYDFSDKESRMFAESVFRDKCKLQCSTPYPLVLRETIKQIVEQVKSCYPDHFVKVNVDTSDMSLEVWKRPMLAEGQTGKKFWSRVHSGIPIPKECLDTSARKVPDGFKVTIPSENGNESSDSMSDEEVEGAVGPALPASLPATQPNTGGKPRNGSASARK
jgi:hypothetical protein